MFFLPTHPPLFTHAKRHCKCECTQRRSFLLQVSPPLTVLYEGTILPVVYNDVETGTVPVTNLPLQSSLGFLAMLLRGVRPAASGVLHSGHFAR